MTDKQYDASNLDKSWIRSALTLSTCNDSFHSLIRTNTKEAWVWNVADNRYLGRFDMMTCELPRGRRAES